MNLEEQFALMKELFYDKGLFVVRFAHEAILASMELFKSKMNYFDQYGMDYHITSGYFLFPKPPPPLFYSQFTIPEKVQTIIPHSWRRTYAHA